MSEASDRLTYTSERLIKCLGETDAIFERPDFADEPDIVVRSLANQRGIMMAQLAILERLDELVAVRAINQAQQLILDGQNNTDERLDQIEAKMPPDLDGDGYGQ